MAQVTQLTNSFRRLNKSESLRKNPLTSGSRPFVEFGHREIRVDNVSLELIEGFIQKEYLQEGEEVNWELRDEDYGNLYKYNPPKGFRGDTWFSENKMDVFRGFRKFRFGLDDYGLEGGIIKFHFEGEHPLPKDHPTHGWSLAYCDAGQKWLEYIEAANIKLKGYLRFEGHAQDEALLENLIEKLKDFEICLDEKKLENRIKELREEVKDKEKKLHELRNRRRERPGEQGVQGRPAKRLRRDGH